MFPPIVLQLKVAPPVEDEPLRVTEGTAHVSILSGPAFTFGEGVTVTVAVAVLVQPFDPETDNVYVVVDAGETVIDDAVLPPGLHR
jgi:hypothetical protein